MKKILLSLLMLLPMVASAEAVEIDGLWYDLNTEAKTAQVIQNKNGMKYSGDIVIPETVTYEEVEYKVRSVGWTAFYYCRELTSVSLPESLAKIESYAFSCCDALTSITIPDNVTGIGERVFEGCTGLSSVSIGSGVNSVSRYAFSRCTSLTTITIPDNVVIISENMFDGCTALTSVTIKGSSYFGPEAFKGCNALKTVIVQQAFPFRIADNVFDEETYQSATLCIPTGRKLFFQENLFWGKFASIVEEDMPDVVIPSSPFDNLYSRRLILSYTNSNIGGSIGSYGNETIVQAIKFPVERMSHIKGNKITHIRFNIWDRFAHVSNMKVFIGSARDKRDLVCQPVADLHEGWNEVALDQPYTITGDSIVVGVDYYMSDDDMIFPIKWGSYSGKADGSLIFFSEGKWQTTDGTWLIQCLAEGDDIPKYDLHFEEIVGLLYKKLVKAGEGYNFTIRLRNWGSMPIYRIDMEALMDGKEIECEPQWDPVIERGGDQQEISYTVTPPVGTPAGCYELSVTPKSLNGEEYKSDAATMKMPMKVYEHDMGRQKILVQVYTGAWCGYCPKFDKLVEEKKQERGDLAVVSIHSRYDYWMAPASESYLSMMYTDGFPNVDLNRCVPRTLYNFSESTIKSSLDNAKAMPAFANVNITGSYDEKSHVLNLTVSGERNEDFLPVEQWTNLTVLLVEDDIIGFQYGAEDPQNYHHPAVLRANISDIWGDRVKWNGDKYEMHYTFSMDDLENIDGAYNVDNMRVVAFLSKPFTGSNYEEINVVNCNEISLKDLTTEIREVNLGPAPMKVYDLNGRMVSPKAANLDGLPHGVYVVGGKKVVK